MIKKAAIIQDVIGICGRTRVMCGIIEILNRKGIVPDLYTFEVMMHPEQIKKQLGYENIKFNIYKVPNLCFGKLQKVEMPLINLMTAFKMRRYDIIINSDNSLLFLPKRVKVLAYIHNPYEKRIKSKILSETNSIKLKSPLSYIFKKLGKVLFLHWLRKINKRLNQDIIVVANSRFTKKKIDYVFSNNINGIPIIHPPVNLKEFWSENPKRKGKIISLGRFCLLKGQLEQINIAEKLPELEFNIMGSVNSSYDRKYFQKSKEHIKEKNIKNIRLLSNCSLGNVIYMLQNSMFFLHTMRNEPFGISTVEAIAAGCIPVVHNSGGQIEIVPFRELRFDDLDESVEIFRKYDNSNDDKLNNLRKQLQDYVRQFDEAVFKYRIEKLINKLLNGTKR